MGYLFVFYSGLRLRGFYNSTEKFPFHRVVLFLLFANVLNKQSKDNRS